MTTRSNFDDQLADWLESGPTDAPDPLLDHIVGALPAIPQRRGIRRFPWSSASMLGLARAVAGIAVVVGLAAAALLIALRPTGDVGGPPPASPTAAAPSSPVAVVPASASPSVVASASPSPSPSASHPVEIHACDSTKLATRIVSWNGAAGSRIADVELTNTSTGRCTIRASSRPQLVDGTGRILIDGAAPGSSPTLTLNAGATLRTMVRSSNYCGPDPVAPVTVAFILGNGDRIVASPSTPTDATVPPCNGSTQPANIEMLAWAP